MANITLSTIHKDIEFLKKAVTEIRANIIDADCILTTEEHLLVNDSFQHEKDGKLISSDELKSELGI